MNTKIERTQDTSKRIIFYGDIPQQRKKTNESNPSHLQLLLVALLIVGLFPGWYLHFFGVTLAMVHGYVVLIVCLWA